MPMDLQVRPTVQDLAGTWRIDPAHTGITFSAKHMMVSTVRGRFDEFEGTFTIDPDDPSKSSAEVTIQAASISTATPTGTRTCARRTSSRLRPTPRCRSAARRWTGYPRRTGRSG